MGKPDTKLSSEHRISDYKRLKKAKDKLGIARLVELRLCERYVHPVESSLAKNGFASMALACLLIETIQSFREGLPDTHRKSRAMFVKFFNEDRRFTAFAPFADDFYYDVRCGLLHQGEARKGWTIMRYRDEALFDPTLKRIHATRFLRRVRNSLNDYCASLTAADWKSELWQNCLKKMDAIVCNCDALN